MAESPVALLPAELVTALTSGVTALTANQRGAHAMRHAYNQAMRRDGQTRWQPPQALALETWLGTCWQRLLVTGAADRLLLNSAQEHALWRAVITADEHLPTEKRQPASADALAQLASHAWRLLLLAEGRGRLQDCASTSEGQAFIRWVTAFEHRLNAGPDRLLSTAQLPQALTAVLRIASAAAFGIGPAGLLLVDFDTLPQATSLLLDALRDAGCPVTSLGTSTPAQTTGLFRAQDDASELDACAHWIRDLRERMPQARIAIVVPRLAERRASLERVFASALGTAPFEAAPPYEFSLGRPLAETTLAASALALLRWASAALPLPAISGLLLSPYLTGGGQQAQSAAEFDAFELRERDALRDRDALRPELTLSAMIAALNSSPRRARVLNLLYRLRNLEQAAADHGITAGSTAAALTCIAVVAAFRAMLHAAGCAPPEHAAPAEHQLWQAWESCLDELATLDATSPQVSLSPQETLAELTRLASARLFAPQSQDAPIQILGPLELSCVRFDALWFLSADDLTWPPTAAASPLLPWRLQHALSLPGADRPRDRQLYAEITSRLAGSATEVIFSYAAEAADGARRPSPLLAALHLTEHRPPDRQVVAAPLERVWIADDSVLPAPAAAEGLRGGAQIFQLQAACAFRAFAELRAFSTGLNTREVGMDQRERGILVHRTMELFWKRVADQQVLRGLTEDARYTTLDGCIAEALAGATAAATHPWDHAYLETQRKRLHQLLAPWLDIEAARPPFAVLQHESKVELAEIGGLRIRSLRVDRIDETTGGLLILDYKTGATHPRDWLGERPEQPQLPVYAAIFSAAQASGNVAAQQTEPGVRSDNLAGVAFATLRAGKSLGLTGFSDDPRVLPTRFPMDQPSFAEQVEDWRRILTTLAEAFVTGDAQVKPLSYPDTCRHCGQRILCRLNPALLPEPNDEDEFPTRPGGAPPAEQLEGEAASD